MVALLEPTLVGSQEPRISCVPDGEEHPQWDEIRDFVAATSTVLDPWQSLVLWTSLLRRADQWAAFAVAACVPRQNGKNAILEMRELVGALLLDEKLIVHSAHLADTSKESFRRLDDLIDANAWLSEQVRHIWRTNGHESIEFKNGNRIRFRTRTRGGGRGFSGSPVIFDEAMFVPEVSMGSILPVISAQPDPQVWYTGSAVDQRVHDDGVVFARVRQRALADDERLAYFEWSLDADSPEDVEPGRAIDAASWAAANPALGRRISLDYVAAEYRELDDRNFSVERLGVGDWPDPDAQSSTVIPIADWDSLADPASSMLDPVAFTFDVSPDRSSASIGVAGRRPDELLHVEVVEHRRGTGWLVERMVELTGAHAFSSVSCDGAGPAASLVPGLEEAGVEVTPVSAGEYAQACGRLVDLVADAVEALREGRPAAGVRHLGTGELRSAIKGAAKRPLGDAWAWSRKNSGVDITPLVAVTLAAWAAAVPAKAETSSWRPL